MLTMFLGLTKIKGLEKERERERNKPCTNYYIKIKRYHTRKKTLKRGRNDLKESILSFLPHNEKSMTGFLGTNNEV